MFYGQCNSCGERWELGTASTCKCPMPDRWVGLTEEEMHSLADKYKEPLLFRFAEFARAVEAKLKEKNNG